MTRDRALVDKPGILQKSGNSSLSLGQSEGKELAACHCTIQGESNEIW